MKSSDIWKYFQDHPEADVCFSTIDGWIFPSHAEAWNHAGNHRDVAWSPNYNNKEKEMEITEWHREDTP